MKSNYLRGIALFGILISFAACSGKNQSVSYQIKRDGVDLSFKAEILKRIGINFGMSLPVDDFGVLTLSPESPDHGFQAEFQLKTYAFVRDRWPDFSEVGQLPTGVAFPDWVKTDLLNIHKDNWNSPEVSWNLYLGARSQSVVAANANVKRIDGRFPDVRLDYVFMNAAGQMVLGAHFYPAQLDSQGGVIVPGGLFIGTDVTRFLPASLNHAILGMSSTSALDLGQQGRSERVVVSVEGKDRADYLSRQKVQALTERYIQELNTSSPGHR